MQHDHGFSCCLEFINVNVTSVTSNGLNPTKDITVDSSLSIEKEYFAVYTIGDKGLLIIII